MTTIDNSVPALPADAAREASRTTRRSPRRSSRGDVRINWRLTAILIVASLSVLIPLYFTVVMSLKSSAEASSGTGLSLPTSINWSNFADAWELTNFGRAASISALISAVTVAGMIIVASLAAFAIAQNWDRRLFRYSYFYLLAAMFIPFPVIALPQIKFMSIVNLSNPFGVALLHILFGLAFNILLYSAFLRSIPASLFESARIDGATTFTLFRKVVFPLLAPMNATVGIFAFLQSWNDFMMPSLIIADPQLQTIPVVQNIFQSQFSNNYNISFASYLMAMAPTVVAYLFAQRWVMSGVTQGAVKE